MPNFGGYSPGAERYGGAVPTLQRVLESLNQNRGSAYDTSNTSNVWVENMAIARGVAALWEQNERLSYQNDPYRMGPTLARWEAILGLSPLPTDTPIDRRIRVQARFQRQGQRVFQQYVDDRLLAALGAVYVRSIRLTPGVDALSWWPGNIQAVVTTTYTGLTVTLPVNAISIASSAGFGDAPSQPAGFAYVTSSLGPQLIQYSGNPAVSQAVSTNTLYGCTGGVGVLTAGATVIKTLAPWYSTVAHLCIKTRVPSGWSEAQYQSAIVKVGPLLDDILPSWMTWTVYRNGAAHTGPWAQDAGAGVYLDESNLDREVFDR